MKKIVLLVSFTMLSFSVFSQGGGDYNYSIGVRGFNYVQMPKIMNQSNSDRYLSTYFNSFMIKFNDNQFSFRVNGSYYKNSDQFFNDCSNCELLKGEMKDYAFKLGFEKNFTYSMIQPYFAFDIGYRSNKFKGTSTSVNSGKTAQNLAVSYDITASKEGFTVSPVLGIKFNPVKQITFFAESNLEFFYYYERQERITQDVLNTRTLNKFNKGEYLINPVSIGIQFHLMNKN